MLLAKEKEKISDSVSCLVINGAGSVANVNSTNSFNTHQSKTDLEYAYLK